MRGSDDKFDRKASQESPNHRLKKAACNRPHADGTG